MSDAKNQTKTPQARTTLSRKLSPSGGFGLKKLREIGGAN